MFNSSENRTLINADERRYFHSSWCAAPMFNSSLNRTSSSIRDLENRATNLHSFVGAPRHVLSPVKIPTNDERPMTNDQHSSFVLRRGPLHSWWCGTLMKSPGKISCRKLLPGLPTKRWIRKAIGRRKGPATPCRSVVCQRSEISRVTERR
jgi:hypothetical protein